MTLTLRGSTALDMDDPKAAAAALIKAADDAAYSRPANPRELAFVLAGYKVMVEKTTATDLTVALVELEMARRELVATRGEVHAAEVALKAAQAST